MARAWPVKPSLFSMRSALYSHCSRLSYSPSGVAQTITFLTGIALRASPLSSAQATPQTMFLLDPEVTKSGRPLLPDWT